MRIAVKVAFGDRPLMNESFGGNAGNTKIAEKLIELINAARQKPDDVNVKRITNTFGLRAKVLALLPPKK